MYYCTTDRLLAQWHAHSLNLVHTTVIAANTITLAYQQHDHQHDHGHHDHQKSHY